MRSRIAVCVLALVSSLPAVVGLGLETVPTEVVLDPASSLVPGTPLNATTPLVVTDGLIPVGLDAQATAQITLDAAEPGAVAQEPAPAALTPTALPSPPPPPGRIALIPALSEPSALAALLLGLLTLAAALQRAVQERLGELLGRFGRGLAGLLSGIALFSRVQHGSVLDNPVRARVHSAVAQDPGLSLSDVRVRTGIAWGTAVHHLRRLEDHGVLVSVNQLARRRYFVAGTPAASQRLALSAVIHPTARRIAHLVAQSPGIDQTGICTTLSLNNPAASKHLHQFEAHGLVLSQRVGRSRHYQPTVAMHTALLALEPASRVRSTATGALNVPVPVMA